MQSLNAILPKVELDLSKTVWLRILSWSMKLVVKIASPLVHSNPNPIGFPASSNYRELDDPVRLAEEYQKFLAR